MANQGYIKLWRKIQDNPLYREKRRFSRSEAWIDLLLMANHKPNEIIVDFKRVPIKRGEVFTSQLGLSKKWNWGIASVNRFLKLLKNENQISYRAESKYTIISILNWDKYQMEAETTRKAERKPERKPLGNHSETNKNDKNEKKIQSSELSSPVKEIISYFKSQVKEIKGFDPEISWAKDSKLVKQRLAKYTPEQFKDLITWYLESKHSERLGVSLATCLSAYIINLWLEDTT